MAPVIDAAAKLQRAKERLYVLCQIGGWGTYLTSQLVFSRAFADKTVSAGRDPLTEVAIIVIIATLLRLQRSFRSYDATHPTP